MPLPTFPLPSAFLALPLEGPPKREFQALQTALDEYSDILSLQKPDSPHLTLYFWKELMEIEYGPVVRKAGEIAARTAPFTLRVTGAETFGDRGQDRVIFLSVAFSPELATLKKLCPWPNLQEFHPHVTLARVRHPQRFAVVKKKVMKLLAGASFPVTADRLRLYGEVKGVKQTALEDFVFKKSQ